MSAIGHFELGSRSLPLALRCEPDCRDDTPAPLRSRARAPAARGARAPGARRPPRLALGTAPVQPIPYSHKQHVALGLQCRDCHVNPDAGRLMAFPPTATCMACHQTVAADRPSIQKLAATRRPARRFPGSGCTRFRTMSSGGHGSHLVADVTCADCHGPVAERDVIALETNVVTMRGLRVLSQQASGLHRL